MEPNLERYLREEERVRWEGRPGEFELFEGTYKTKFMIRCLIALAVAVGVVAVQLSRGPDPQLALTVVILFMIAIVALAPLGEKSKLMKCRYWITEQRIILLGSDEALHYMELNEVDVVKTVTDGAGRKCLVIGTPVLRDAKKNARWRAAMPKAVDETGGSKEHSAGMILYNLPDNNEVMALLKKQGCAVVA